MPFTLNGACFFPFSRLFSTPTASPATPPFAFLISWQGVTYLLFPSLSLCFHLIFKREIWINFFCVAEGMTSCELQILANTAIYLKWQIRRSNLLGIRRFFELSSFEKVCVFPSRGEHLLRNNLFCALMKKYNSEEQDGL